MLFYLISHYITQDLKWWLYPFNFDAELLLSYIVVLRWPIVAFYGLALIRPHIPKLVQRLRKFGAGPVDAEFDPTAEQGIGTSEASQLAEENKEVKEAAAEEMSEDDLDKYLTTPEAKAAFDQVYNKIFGTQLMLLKRLKDYIATGGLAEPDLEDLFRAHQKSSDPAYPSFQAFVQFLIDNTLLNYDVKDKHYKLTYAGLYFLNHLTDKGVYGLFKPY